MIKAFALFFLIHCKCAAAIRDCWWTGCQPDTWQVTGCAQYDREEDGKKSCIDESGSAGSTYNCCEKEKASKEECFWSACDAFNTTSCPKSMTLKSTYVCDEQSHMLECCGKFHTDIGRGNSSAFGETFEDLVKNLFMEEDDFAAKPDRLRCDQVDTDKKLAVKINDHEAIRICDLCPNLPQKYLANLFLDREAANTTENVHFRDCFGLCYEEKKCMALSYDQEASTCYLFDSTAGGFVEDAGWASVIMTQPTGIVGGWTYTRNTRTLGHLKKASSQQSFLHCLEDCEETDGCNFVSYEALPKTCSLFGEQNDVLFVDLIYGHISAIRASYSLKSRDVQDRFVLEGDELKVKKITPVKEEKCAHLMDETHGASVSQSCIVSGSAVLGCEQSTGCKRCYYPEKTDAFEQLSICPDSEFERLKSVKSAISESMNACFEKETCVGIGYNIKTEEVSPMTLKSYINGGYNTKFMLKFPPNDKRRYLGNVALIPNALVEPLSNADHKDIADQTFEQCSEALSGSSYIVSSYSHDSKQCRLTNERVSFKLETKGGLIVSYKNPSLTSSALRYLKAPGLTITSKGRAISNCDKNCVEVCSKLCSHEYSQWCAYFVLKQQASGAKCEFYDNDSNFQFAVEGTSTIFSKVSTLDFTLESLDKLSNFQAMDFLACFDSVNEQTQTSLALNEIGAVDEIQRFRVKRDGWDILKAIGNGIVDGAKKTFNGLVNTGKGVVNTVKNLAKGDTDKAKDAFLKIPVVDFVKNTGELTGAVFTQDWGKAKEKGLEILDSEGFDLVTSVALPGSGKILSGAKNIFNAGKNLAKRATKKIVNTGKKKMDDVAKAGRNVKNSGKPKPKEKKSQKKKKEEEQIERERGEKCKKQRSKRAKTPKSKRHKPGDCKKQDENKCAKPTNVKFSIAKTFNDCANRAVGAKCRYECKPGYKEKKVEATCMKRKGKAVWEPFPECELIPCNRGNKHLIVYETPQSPLLGRLALGDYIVAYVSYFDSKRRLPIWSVALHQSDQFEFLSKNYNAMETFNRTNFVRYPCNELKDLQTTNADYAGRGNIWQKGHLTPANPFRWSLKASKITSVYTNGAPQERYTNQGPWSRVESEVYCFSKRHRTIVATGVCPGSLTDSIGSGIKVPKCFWKLICYRDENSKERVVGFFASNVRPKNKKEEEARSAEVRTPLSQVELVLKVGTTFHDAWTRAARHINKGRPVPVGESAAVWMPINSFSCRNAETLPENEKEAWEAALSPPTPPSGKNRNRGTRAARLDRGCHPDERKSALDAVGYFLPLDEYSGADEEGSDEEEDSGEDGGKGDGDGSVKVGVQKCGKRIVGYYTSWGTKTIGGLELQRLTHVIYAFLEVYADGHIAIGSADRKNAEDADKETRKSKQRLEDLMRSAQMYPHVKVLFAVGGWENSQYFSGIAASPSMRVTFIASIIRMIEDYGFDGVDIDWEYPVTGGANEGIPADKQNYVTMMREIRGALDGLANRVGRKEKFLLSFAGAAGQWTLDPGYDLPGLLKYADFANIMSYDFFGAWTSKWGAYTGPPSPLYFGMPKGFSGKTNADWAVKYYTCKSKFPHKINMGLPFYGRYWKNVGGPVDGKDGMWRTASAVNGQFEGGYVPWHEVKEKYINNGAFEKKYHEKAQTPYAWNPSEKIFLGYEDKRSLEAKVKYAVDKNVGGLMIWALEQDDDDLTLLDIVSKANLCKNTNPKEISHKCSPIDDKRWWTPEDGEDKAGLCGRSAPLYKGFYPVCDPDDPGYSCCGAAGYCGSGPDYCDCPTCRDFRKNPKLILKEPIKPSIPVTWYLLNDPDGKRGRCGRKIPKINGVYPTCNPDDENNYCCSNGGYCGNKDEFCKCNGCVDFKKNKNYKFGPKKWWTLEDGKDLGGQCGPKAPKVDGIYEAECEGSSNFHCCSPLGWCGSGAKFCDCDGCKDFKGKN